MEDSSLLETRPMWVDPEESEYPALAEDITVDVAVVGAGIAGLAVGRWLESEGIRSVAILDRRTVGSGASGRNAGFVMAVAPENFPTPNAAGNGETSHRIWAFTAENQRQIEAALEEYQIDAHYSRRGSLGLAAYPEEWDWIVASTEMARRAGLRVDLIERQDLPGEWLRRNYFGGAWYGDNAEIDPGRLTRGLALRLSRRGLSIFERSWVNRIDASSTGFILSVGHHRVLAERVVIATNAYTYELLPEIGPHIAPRRGQVLATAPFDRTVAGCPVYANDGFQYWRQTRSGRLLLGGWRNLDIEGEVGTQERLNEPIQMELTRVAEGLCEGPVEVEYRWSGIMGFTPDHRPLVGFLPECGNLLMTAGFSGHGMAMAFNSARQAVDMLLGRISPYQDLFGPDRFAGGT